MTDEGPRRDERATLLARVEQAVGALFTIEAEIGRGGMGVVYRARDVRLRRKVALKVLPPELAFRDDVKSRFLREAQTSAQLSHPNIVPIYTVDELDGIVFFAMGLVQGETLATQLQRAPRPPVATVRTLLREVADALAYAHAHDVVHRDVKPDNILVDDATGHALVSDFGIARAAEGDSRLTVTGIAVGTPAYMSPEQAMGERGVDGRSDIYSLGVVGYQMLAGDLPFRAANTPAMLMKHISERPAPLGELRPDLPANLVYAIERAMAKGREDRWPDASAFRDALSEEAVPGPRLRDAQPAAPAAPAQSGDEFAGGVRFPPFPAIGAGGGARRKRGEPGYGQTELEEWRAQARLWREQVRQQAPMARRIAREERREDRELRRSERTPEERIRRAQRALFGTVGWLAFLAAINVTTSPHFLWVVFPALGMGMNVFGRVTGLLVDGIPLRRLFQRQPLPPPDSEESRMERGARLPAPPRASAPPAARVDLGGISREVLEGSHGAAIREAAEAKAVIGDVLSKLSVADRELLPEIQPTVDLLVDRVRSLAQALHQLDRDASAEAIARLEQRIAETRAMAAEAPERDRRLQLLERQLATLTDLAARRVTVSQQLESASLVLETMKLDLLKLRSSGLESRLDASTGATQEARALSTDIGRIIEAANEVRRI